MKEHPILFNGPMVRALLAGQKTQTRRIAPITDLNIKPCSDNMVTWGVHFSKPVKGSIGSYSGGKFSVEQAQRIIASMFNPFGQPGDRLWVREAHAIVPRTAYAHSDGVPQTLRPNDDHDAAIYREGWTRSRGGFSWRPSIHMPRWASRITLEIVGVRVERLREISDTDAISEGCNGGQGSIPDYAYSATPGEHFMHVWASAYGNGSWIANPWVWVVEFRRLP